MNPPPCARGCTLDGQHAPPCDGNDCGGCLPRPADTGHLCERCYTALRRDLATAPSLINWLRQHVEPGGPRQDGKTTGTRNPPAPLSADAVAAADDLHAMLASWVLLILEEHPSRLHGPSWEGSAVRPVSKRTVDGGEWQARVYEDARVVGVEPPRQHELTWPLDRLGYPVELGYAPPRTVTYTEHIDATSPVTKWLLTQLDWCAAQDWAGEMAREVTETTATLLARWPQEARARTITDLPCPKCDRISLVYYPVATFLGKVLVQCEHHDCGRTIDEDMWPHYARVILDARRGGA